MTTGKKVPYREEALQHSAEGRTKGDVLRMSSAWTSWAYWVVVAAFVNGLVFGVLGAVSEYASGPAVVWITGRTELTATVAGTVRSVEISAGQRVQPGDVLVRFDSAREQADLERIQQEFDLQLMKTLREPTDEAARETLTALRTQRELALARLDQLTLRAPRAGAIGDVRIRPGQPLSVGDIALTLLDEDTRCSVVAMLPAHYRPQLRPGASLRFEVSGYRYAYQEMLVESVGAEIIGPDQVKRYLGQELQDTVRVEGPVVLVEARPPSPSFRVDGNTFNFYHGMNGIAEVRVRSESILLAVIPSLRVVIEKLRG